MHISHSRQEKPRKSAKPRNLAIRTSAQNSWKGTEEKLCKCASFPDRLAQPKSKHSTVITCSEWSSSITLFEAAESAL